ncbi:lysozyme inhibitor LprI family protein [Aurantimonas sp. E1-2-R+4]|uniref:lysozyme inhibitor LprI family protein n=1 Tax=Aurantimonas sp. E1-2-R+4 TaxID=3113714 RepID=UPI002F91C7E2
MQRLLLILSSLAVLAQPASAQSKDAKADLATIRTCLSDQVDDPRSCIGTVANPCQGALGGASTIGIDTCLGRETAAWDTLLNKSYKIAVASAETMDKRLVSDGIYEPGVAAALVKAQRAWIAYRDAECDRRYELFKEGTIRTNIASDCLLELTAQRAIEFRGEE